MSDADCTPGREPRSIAASFWTILYIVCLFASYASPLIFFSSLFPYLSTPLLISSFKNRPPPEVTRGDQTWTFLVEWQLKWSQSANHFQTNVCCLHIFVRRQQMWTFPFPVSDAVTYCCEHASGVTTNPGPPAAEHSHRPLPAIEFYGSRKFMGMSC